MPTRVEPREHMIARQLVRRGINDSRVLEAMRAVPREQFVDPGFEEFAYEDTPLPISEKQTISQPYIVALMAEKAEIKPGDTVLEIGTGSGYGAAILSRIAAQVMTVERHASLARVAEERFRALGFENIAVRIGDGTAGWPEAGPYDAIVVTAATSEIPRALKEQLDIGGHMIIPIGDRTEQRLLRVGRTAATTFEERDLGGVRFVPLVSEAWTAPERAPLRQPEPAPSPAALSRQIAEAAEPLPEIDDPAFGALLDRFGDRRVVLIGEASHGTCEFYRARAAITRRLIEHHGFTIVAAEADWPDAAAVDRYVRHRPGRERLEQAFRRFPTWMWRNVEVLDSTRWLREYNGTLPEPERVRFHGLDMYNMRGSIAAVLSYLDSVDPEAAAVARERYGCLTPWQNEPSTYGRAVLTEGYRKCEEMVVEQCREMLQRAFGTAARDGDELVDAMHAARLVASAEKYYRTMYYGDVSAWNLRDRHMYETLEMLLDTPRENAKAVIWAHNSHIGDARHTDMGEMRNEINIGQLCRERFGEDCALIGLGTNTGTVAAADDWDGEMRVKEVRPALDESYERIFHAAGERYLVDFGRHEQLSRALAEPRLERFIGVIYRPESERLSHYTYASISSQFDAWLWFDRTSAVTPIDAEHIAEGVPDTFPFGL